MLGPRHSETIRSNYCLLVSCAPQSIREDVLKIQTHFNLIGTELMMEVPDDYGKPHGTPHGPVITGNL